jgi:hypothetical protein
MAPPVEAQVDAVVDQALARQSIAETGFDEQIDRALLEDTRADPMLDVLPAASFNNDRFDPLEVQEMRQQQSGGPGADDPDLGPRDSAGTPNVVQSGWLGRSPCAESTMPAAPVSTAISSLRPDQVRHGLHVGRVAGEAQAPEVPAVLDRLEQRVMVVSPV